MHKGNLSPNGIDGVTGSHNIVTMWKSHYEDLFNCLSNSKDVNTICKNAEYQKDIEVSHSEIIHAIKYLKDNKSCGLDGISEEHLKHCNDDIIPLLYVCFTSLFIHGTLTESMIYLALVPIVINKTAGICSNSNCRPIALASIVSKVFEKKIFVTILHIAFIFFFPFSHYVGSAVRILDFQNVLSCTSSWMIRSSCLSIHLPLRLPRSFS